MTYKKAKSHILWVFLAALFLGWTLLLIVRLRGQVFDDSFLQLTLVLLKVYSGNVIIVFTSILFEEKQRTKPYNNQAYRIAMILSVLWNLLLLTRIAIFAFSATDDVAMLEQYLQEVALSSAFIISGVLTYFFAKSAS